MSLHARALAEEIVDRDGRLKPGYQDLQHEITSGWLERVGAGEVLEVDADA
jgi:hypothetical protein